MSNILTKIWEFLSQPLLPEDARIWFSVAIFALFVFFPFWVLLYGKDINRGRGREAEIGNRRIVRGANQK
jgi:hypothetical protein